MSVIKLTANIALQGRTMYGEEACQSDHNLTEHNSMTVHGRTNNGKKNPNDTEVIHFYTRKCIPAIQVINMTEEAYNYMTSNEVPSFSNKSTWSKLNKKQRIEVHLKELAESLNGKLINFTVYPD